MIHGKGKVIEDSHTGFQFAQCIKKILIIFVVIIIISGIISGALITRIIILREEVTWQSASVLIHDRQCHNRGLRM